MFKVISDIMAQWYLMVNAFIMTINFYNAKKMNSHHNQSLCREKKLSIEVYHEQS